MGTPCRDSSDLGPPPLRWVPHPAQTGPRLEPLRASQPASQPASQRGWLACLASCVRACASASERRMTDDKVFITHRTPEVFRTRPPPLTDRSSSPPIECGTARETEHVRDQIGGECTYIRQCPRWDGMRWTASRPAIAPATQGRGRRLETRRGWAQPRSYGLSEKAGGVLPSFQSARRSAGALGATVVDDRHVPERSMGEELQ